MGACVFLLFGGIAAPPPPPPAHHASGNFKTLAPHLEHLKMREARLPHLKVGKLAIAELVGTYRKQARSCSGRSRVPGR